MSVIQPVITDAGLAAANAAETGGFQINISELAVGDGRLTPASTVTALDNEIKRLPIGAPAPAQPNIAHINGIDDSGDVYDVSEIGFYLDDGTLLCYYAPASGNIGSKTAANIFAFAMDLVLSALPPGVITVSAASIFDLPFATETQRGIAEIATLAEMLTGTDNDRVVSAKHWKEAHTWANLPDQPTVFPSEGHSHDAGEIVTGVFNIARIPDINGSKITGTVDGDNLQAASSTKQGAVELATNAEAIAGTATNRAMTPANFAAAHTWGSLSNIPSQLEQFGAITGSFGSLNLSGVTGGYAGINFTGVSRRFLVNGSSQGIHDGTSWKWRFDAGTLAVGTVPWARLSGVPISSMSDQGLIEIATQAEAAAGSDDTRAITPAKLDYVLGNYDFDWGNLTGIPAATLTVQGIVELATDAETRTGTDATRAITPAGLRSAMYEHVPSGAIVMWESATIPTGWRLCNGTNSTPDLRNRFIVGAGSTYATGARGGNSGNVNTSSAGSHSHSDTFSVSIGNTTLSSSQIPSHRHSLTGRTDGGGSTLNIDNSSGTQYTNYTGYTGGGGSHNHTATVNGGVSSGGAHTHTYNPTPLYHALYFIKKI